MAPGDDETVRLRPGRGRRSGAVLPSRRFFVGCAICAGLAPGAGFGWQALRRPGAPPTPRIAIATAGETEIAAHRSADLDVFRFDHNPKIVVLDFASLARQGAMLNRLAAMIEKNSQPHDRALDDADLDRAIRSGGDTPETFYFGHDYGAVSLTRFFAAVERQKLSLTADERWLHALLRQLDMDGDALGLISIPAIGAAGVTASMRATILHHELSHGEYFTNPAYAGWTRTFWENVLDAPARAAFRGFLVAQNYDPSIEELLANETQAYLMFTPSPDFFRPDLVAMTAQTVAEWRRRFRDGMPPGWLRDQAMREAGPI